MEIIFDQQRSENPKLKREQLEALGNFTGADVVKFEEDGRSETYIITRGSEKLTLKALGNQFDGGWLVVQPA